MPYSLPSGKDKVREWVLDHVPPAATALDVGAGAGAYGALLSDHLRAIDAVEIHPPYIQRFNLNRIYRHVFLRDVRDMTADDFAPYRFVIFGDVIEHMSTEDAQAVLLASADVEFAIVCVPFLREQGAVDGVESERHLQPDLTHELFGQRFPGFKWLCWKRRKDSEIAGGYYVRIN